MGQGHHQGNVTGLRGSATWGRRGGRTLVLLLTAALALTASGAASAGDGHTRHKPKVDPALYEAAQTDPAGAFRVIVQGQSASDAAVEVRSVGAGARLLRSIDGAATTVTGSQLIGLAGDSGVDSIVPDLPVETAGLGSGIMWRQTIDVPAKAHGRAARLLGTPPAVAVVDSGIESRESFDNRILAHVNLSSLSPGATGDDMGHGTMVAGILAGSAKAYPGVAPAAPLVDLRVTDGAGHAMTSDVIAACDWILTHRNQYRIGVANLSLVGNIPTTFRYDPLDKAVERLWLNGIVVVAAAGNGGSPGSPVDMSYAPGNDPFVITVGATDQQGTPDPADDTAAPWSAFGHTIDGFAKPELSAPGRFIVGPVPSMSYLEAKLTGRKVSPGFIWMSGTSFSTPMVAGAAALVLAAHPSWSPDQVKGALMSSASALPLAGMAGGIGELDVAHAVELTSAPNPNENLNAFVVSNDGTAEFDADAWGRYVSSHSNWTSSSWTSSNWTSSNWTSSNWTSSNWTSSNWTSSNWTSATDTASNWVE